MRFGLGDEEKQGLEWERKREESEGAMKGEEDAPLGLLLKIICYVAVGTVLFGKHCYFFGYNKWVPQLSLWVLVRLLLIYWIFMHALAGTVGGRRFVVACFWRRGPKIRINKNVPTFDVDSCHHHII